MYFKKLSIAYRMAQFANSEEYKKYIENNNFNKVQKFTKENKPIDNKNNSINLRNAFTWLMHKK